MSPDDTNTPLTDGRPHAFPCPAARHGKEPARAMLYVRYLTANDIWLLHCWGRPSCDFGEIAQLLDIDTNSDRVIRKSLVTDLVAAYDNTDPAKQPSLVFHSWRNGGESPPSRESRGSRQVGSRGSATGAGLMLWAPEEGGRCDTTLLVVGSEEEAMSLMRAGVYRNGYVPVTWHRAGRRLEDDQQSVEHVDWSTVRGRRVAFWPARTPQAHGEMLHAAGMANVAGATRLLLLDPQGSGLGEGDDAATMTDPGEIMAVLRHMRVLPGPHGEEADSDIAPEPSALRSLLEPRVETATDVSMAVRVLREHGHDMVLASRQAGSEPGVDVYWRTGTGAVETRPDELGIVLWESRGRYVEALRAALDAGDLSSEDYMVCIAHANRMDSSSGLRAVADSLGTAYGVLERLGAVPGGLSRVNASSIDPATGHPLPGSAGRPWTGADVWLSEAIEITGNPSHRLSSSALWEAAGAAAGSGADPERAWGLSRRAFTTRAIQIHALPRTRSVRVEREVYSGWNGIRLAADRDVAGN